MIGSKIKFCLSKSVMIPCLFVFFNSEAFAHGGGLNSEGCHNDRKTGGYHCHRGGGSRQTGPGPSLSINKNEKHFNDIFARALGGKTEVRLNFSVPESDLTGYVIIDIETSDMVIEGGLDKRSSLDSVQQALFASTITGKTPTVAIYDTDGIWGKIEHRVFTAAKKAGVKFYWINGNSYQER